MDSEMKRPPWFKMRAQLEPLFGAVSDQAAGRALKAVMRYLVAGELMKLNSVESVIFAALKGDVDEACADYLRDVENGKKGGRPRKKKEEKPPVLENNPPKPSGTEEEGEEEIRKKNKKNSAADKPPACDVQSAADRPPACDDQDDREDSLCTQAVALLNQLTGSSFRPSARATSRAIAARQREGYTLPDFQRVIRHQCALWGSDERMRRYLRPETLFGSKFEGYLMDAARSGPKEDRGYVLAPMEDPFEAAVREGSFHG